MKKILACLLAICAWPSFADESVDQTQLAAPDCEVRLSSIFYRDLTTARAAVVDPTQPLPMKTIVGIANPEDVAAGRYEMRSLDELHALRSEILARSHEAIVTVNGRSLYLGVFITKSLFAKIAQGNEGGQFPSVEEMEKRLDQQPHAIWHPDGQVEMRTAGFRKEMKRRFLAAHRGKAPVFFRGGGYESPLIQLFWSEDPAEQLSLRAQIVEGWKLDAAKFKDFDKQAFLREAFAARKGAPFLFFAPNPRWAGYFSGDTTGNIVEFKMRANELPSEQWPVMYFGADNFGQNPSDVELVARVATFADFLRVARLFQPVNVYQGAAVYGLQLTDAYGQRRHKIPVREIKDELGKPDIDFERLVELFSREAVLAQALASDAGVSERETILQHVRNIYVRYLDQRTHYGLDAISARAGLSLDRLFHLLILVHDIGKPAAIKAGNKNLQHRFTWPIVKDLAAQLHMSDREILLLETLINYDFLGSLLQGSLKAADVVNRLQKEAGWRNIALPDLIRIFQLFYIIDAGAYPRLERALMRRDTSGRICLKEEMKPSLGELASHLCIL